MKRKFLNLRIFDGPTLPSVAFAEAAALIETQMAPEIFKGAIENSLFLSMARRLPNMTARQMRLPVLGSLPMAYFLQGEKDLKQVTNLAWEDKYINAGEIAVFVPFAKAVADDASYDLVGEAIPLLGQAAGQAIDRATVFGDGKPTFWPKSIVDQAIEAGAVKDESLSIYDDVLGPGGTAGMVEESGYDVTGHMGSVSMKQRLRGIKDETGRPIFMSSMQQASNYTLDGSPIRFMRNGAFDTKKASLITGDFSQAVYSIRQDITIDIFNQNVIQDPNTKQIVYNMAQQDMFCIRMVMRLGWELPNPVNALNGTASRFPFAVLRPKQAGGSAARNAGANAGGYTEEQLNGKTIDEIRALAAGLGYTITKTVKAEIIAEFLEQQNAKG